MTITTGRFNEHYPGFYSDFECCTDVDIKDVLVLHGLVRHYHGPGFILAKYVVPGVEEHDQYNDCIPVTNWPAMKAYIEANR